MLLIQKKGFSKIDFKAVWPRDGHAASVGVNVTWNSFLISVTTQLMVSVIRAFLYAILAQASFLLFPHELFGLIYGVLNLLNGFTTLFADPIFRMIQTYLEGDFTPVHYVLAVTTILTLFEPFVLLKFKANQIVAK